MRRRTGLLFVIALLLILAGGYTAFWYITAGKLEQGLGEWAEGGRAPKDTAAWGPRRGGGGGSSAKSRGVVALPAGRRFPVCVPLGAARCPVARRGDQSAGR